MSKSASKFYVVWSGRETGIFTDWATCKGHVDGFPGARYKSFPSQDEAEAAYGKPMRKNAAKESSAAMASKGSMSREPSLKLNDHLIAMIEVDTKIYADGACNPNPGPSGSGVAVFRGEELSELWHGLYLANGTNNTAELGALHYAMILAAEEVSAGRSAAIFTDSKYSLQCVTQWAAGWEKRGWVRKEGAIKNLDLIKTLFSLWKTIKGQVVIHHVNGHAGIMGNELADRMSLLAIESGGAEWDRYQGEFNVPEILAIRPA